LQEEESYRPMTRPRDVTTTQRPSLTLDALDAAKSGRDPAGFDLDDAVAAFDQRGAVIDAAQHPARHDGLAQRGLCVGSRECPAGACGRAAIEPVMSAAGGRVATAAVVVVAAGGAPPRGAARLAFSRGRASSVSLAIWLFCVVLDAFTAVFSAARLSLSDFVVARSLRHGVAQTPSRRRRHCPSAPARRDRDGRPGPNIGPSACDAERSRRPHRKLAAIATQAAQAARSAHCCAAS
jgi:hypothetical protein